MNTPGPKGRLAFSIEKVILSVLLVPECKINDSYKQSEEIVLKLVNEIGEIYGNTTGMIF